MLNLLKKHHLSTHFQTGHYSETEPDSAPGGHYLGGGGGKYTEKPGVHQKI